MAESKYRALTSEESYILLHKGTERPFSGEYENHFKKGTYHCKQCNSPLYRSEDKFHSGCGWPSFDDEIEGAVEHRKDIDGVRTEIVCTNCGGHLGHVFKGEHFTEKNTRHCVNSLSMVFNAATSQKEHATAYFAAGCFWGVEHLFKAVTGVLDTNCGYMGGTVDHPTYKQVCYTDTGHLEAVKVIYDPAVVTYEALVKFFFEIHDPTQKDGQGPDRGSQYLSAVFVENGNDRKIVEEIIALLHTKGLNIATKVKEVAPFWMAEEYHQDYYDKTGKQPYCHFYNKRF